MIISKIDRLGRNLRDLIVTGLEARGVAVKSLTNGIVDTTTAHGKRVFGMFALMAEYEATLIKERTVAGLVAARARGRTGGVNQEAFIPRLQRWRTTSPSLISHNSDDRYATLVRYARISIMATIAAADDDLDVRTVVRRVLVRAGHEVSTYDDGAALVEEVRAHHPDVVVTDNEMPVMTGLEVVQTLHDDPDTADIPIVIASGSVSEATAAEVLHDGDQLVPKPFTPAQLQHSVDAALDSTQATP
jgi:CheY-like chemotaxis protein